MDLKQKLDKLTVLKKRYENWRCYMAKEAEKPVMLKDIEWLISELELALIPKGGSNE